MNRPELGPIPGPRLGPALGTGDSVLGPVGGASLVSLLISPDPGVILSPSALQFTATGTYSDASTRNDTANATWTISTTPFMTIGASNGQVIETAWGQINGGSAGITASIGAISDNVVARIVAHDSASMRVYMPQSDAQWQALGLSPWGGWWGCQEVATDLVGSGSAAFTLSRINTPLGGVGVANWTRKGLYVSGADAGQNFGWRAAAGVGPNIQTTSVAWLGYFLFQGGTGGRSIIGHSENAQFVAQANGPNILRLNVSGTTTNASTSHDDGRVHPILLVKDGTNSRVKMYTDLNKVTGTFPSTAFYDGGKGYGAVAGSASPSGTMMFMAYCTGSVAEALSTDGVASAFLKSLGWSNTAW